MFKTVVRPLLNRIVTRDRFNDSSIYKVYLSLFCREVAERRRQELCFYKDVVGHDRSLIFDIGASTGHKANIFRQLAKQVVCVEPTPTAVKALRRRFLHEPRVSIVPKGVGDSAPCKFHVFSEGGPYNTVSTKLVEAMRTAAPDSRLPHFTTGRSITIEMTTLDALIRQFGKYYVKVDVEDNEAAVGDTARQFRVQFARICRGN
jgi:FkbM family methyltransferase